MLRLNGLPVDGLHLIRYTEHTETAGEPLSRSAIHAAVSLRRRWSNMTRGVVRIVKDAQINGIA